MGHFLRKYSLILWKNYLIRKRHWFVTILEIVIPVLLFLLIALLRGHLSYLKAIPVNNATIYPPISESDFIAEEFNIIYSPQNDFTTDIIRRISSKLPKTQTYPCKSEGEMEIKFIKIKESYTPNIFGVVFEVTSYGDEKPIDFHYKIRPGQLYWFTEDIMPVTPTSGPMEISDRYISNHFTQLQLALDKSFIEYSIKGSGDADIPFKVNISPNKFVFEKFPYPPYIKDTEIESVFTELLPICTWTSFLILFIQVVKRVVEEKASGAKELMCMMGMPRGIQWLGWFTSTMAVILIVLIFIMIFLTLGFEQTPILRFSNGFLIFLFFLMYCVSSVLICFVIASIFSKESFAVSVALMFEALSAFVIVIIGKTEIGYLLKIIISLFPNVGIVYGFKVISLLEAKGSGLQWNNLWSKPRNRSLDLSMGNVLMVFVAVCIICMVLVWYFDRVLPGKYGVARPWYFPFVDLCGLPRFLKPRKLLCNSENLHLAQYNGTESMHDMEHCGQFEALPPGKMAGIKIRGLKKVFGGSSWLGARENVAVNNVSLDILKGEITALLGHNGAGKTTLISILTGIFSATDGKVTMGGYDIEKDMEKIRENLGLCPQHSMLFSDVTVWEHLIFFAMSKGLSHSTAAKEALHLMKTLELESKKDELSSKLSGGMKRKLSLGMALIGNSKIVFLDEPTSGMDPESRRHLWDLLLSMRGERTILLTTHYMEEADVLGDRIAIMDHGKVKCYGTSLFLKKAFGTGYHLTILVDSEIRKRSAMQEVKSQVTNLVKQIVPGASSGKHSGDELYYTLPTNATDSFAELFVQLDRQGKDMNINGLTLSVTTLEEVFLMVGKLDQVVGEDEVDHGASNSSSPVSSREALNVEEISWIHLTLQQAEALFIKKLQFIRAIWNQLLFRGILGMVFLLLTMKNTVPSYYSPNEAPLTFSISDYHNSIAFSSGIGLKGVKAEKIYAGMLTEKGTSVRRVPLDGNVIDALLDAALEDEAAYRDNYVVSAKFEDGEATSYFSTNLYHSCPTSLNLVTTTLLRLLSNSVNGSISTTVHPFADESHLSSASDGMRNAINAFVWMSLPSYGLLFLTSAFVILPILEGSSGSRHLQLMTMSSSTSLFWIVSLLFDIAIYLIFILLSLAVFPIITGGTTYGADFNGVLFLTFLLFGFSTIPFAYLMSYFKETVGSGISLYINISIVMGWILGVIVIALEELVFVPELAYILRIIGLTIPNCALILGLKKFSIITSYNSKCSIIPSDMKEKLCTTEGLSQIDNSVDISCCENLCKKFGNCFSPVSYLGWSPFSPQQSFSTPYGMSIELLTLAVLCPFYIGVLYLIDVGVFSNSIEKILEFLMKMLRKDGGEEDENIPEDEDVAKEKDRIDFFLRSGHKEKGKDTLIVHNLKKNYGWFRWLRGGHRAVKGISFGVDSGDCFGLLGANGAGKTSTFGMITGSHPNSSGVTYVLDEKSRNFLGKNSKYEAYIGYCPQFNATLGALTGRQMLTLYARLRGISKNHLKQEVQKWLNFMDISDLADKPCKNYSGGNHRRLSAAIALMGNRPLIALDEPTAGVDPIARRSMWDALNSTRASGTALVLTSHSMEECEALCTKLSIMVNGRFVCIGTVPYLKNKFGQGFTLLIKLNVLTGSSVSSGLCINDLKETIYTAFEPCSIKDEHEGLLHYHIMNPQTKWDYMFSTMEELKRNYSPLVEDYSLSDTTLEQVFLSFVRSQKETTEDCNV